jgi:hypothetical protein
LTVPAVEDYTCQLGPRVAGRIDGSVLFPERNRTGAGSPELLEILR